MNTTRLEMILDEATSFAAFEAPGPALWRQVERAAQVVLHAEQAQGRIRAFHVRCDAELNPPGSEGVAFEVSVQPPGPRAKGITLHLRTR